LWNMNKVSILAILAAILANLACVMSAAQFPTPTPQAAPTLSPSPQPSATPTATPRATEAAADTVVVVRQPIVNVRSAAGGDPTGEYVYAGEKLTVLDTVMLDSGDEWVRIAEPAGWIFAGCLEGSERGCVAE
jgi:hypothetical protein